MISVRARKLLRLVTDDEAKCRLLKKYEGFVTACGPDTFAARIFEGSDDHPAIEAEIGLDELSDGERSLVTEGARFVWTISYRMDGGTRRRESAIYFRRLPPLSDAEAACNAAKVAELMNGIAWE